MTTTALTVPQIGTAKIEPSDEAQQMVTTLERRAEIFRIVETNDDCETVNELMKSAHATAQILENARKEAKAPFIEIGRKIDDTLNPLITRAISVKTKLSELLLAYKRRLEKAAEELRRKQEEERLEAERKAKEEARKAEIARRKNTPEAPPVQIQLPTPKPQLTVEIPKIAAHSRKIKVLEVFDESIVPINVMTKEGKICIRPIDEVAVRAMLAAGINVPGCRMIEKETTTTR